MQTLIADDEQLGEAGDGILGGPEGWAESVAAAQISLFAVRHPRHITSNICEYITRKFPLKY